MVVANKERNENNAIHSPTKTKRSQSQTLCYQWGNLVGKNLGHLVYQSGCATNPQNKQWKGAMSSNQQEKEETSNPQWENQISIAIYSLVVNPKP